jgi:hypothetical protein
MSTIAVPTTSTTETTGTTTKLPARAKVAAGLAVPLGLMGLVGAVIFWEWSWLTWVAVWGGAQAAAALIAAALIFAGRQRGVALLRYAMISELVFTAMKLVFWQEVEAASFGVVALAVYLVIRERPTTGRV